jgi:HD domain/GAF domain
LLGTTLFDGAWHPCDEKGTPLAPADQPHRVAMATGEARQGVVTGITLPDGRRRWYSVNVYPVRVDGEVIGVVTSYFDQSDRVMRESTMSIVTEISRFIALATDEADAQRYLCHHLVDEAGYELAWIAVALPGEDYAVDVAFAAGETDYLQAGMVSWSGSNANGLGPVGTCLRTGRPQVIGDLVNQALYAPWRDRARSFGLRSSAAIPFSPGGQRACLSVYSRYVDAFPEPVMRALESITREVEFGITHIHSMNQVAGALDGILAALSRITEARDPYTAGHQSKVGSLSAAIAAHMGIDAPTVELIRQAGDVHDVGKTAIASEILTKPGRLTALEYQMVQRHAKFGYDILAEAKLPWPIADVALQHHERVDGSGYPQGLSASEIILPARIVAVADVIEAMTNHRPYRSELGLERALDEVNSKAGQLYDAEVVKNCMAIFDAGFTFASPGEPSAYGDR